MSMAQALKRCSSSSTCRSSSPSSTSRSTSLEDQHHHVQEAEEDLHHQHLALPAMPFDDATVAANEAIAAIENNQEEELEQGVSFLFFVLFFIFAGHFLDRGWGRDGDQSGRRRSSELDHLQGRSCGTQVHGRDFVRLVDT